MIIRIFLLTITGIIVPYLLGLLANYFTDYFEPQNLVVDSILYWLMGSLVLIVCVIIFLAVKKN